mgnify:CR=1 FL=1
MDRFIVKLSIGYPTPEEEDEILKRRAERKKDIVPLQAVISPDGGEVAYVVSRVDPGSMASISHVWLFDLATDRARQLTRGGTCCGPQSGTLPGVTGLVSNDTADDCTGMSHTPTRRSRQSGNIGD